LGKKKATRAGENWAREEEKGQERSPGMGGDISLASKFNRGEGRVKKRRGKS